MSKGERAEFKWVVVWAVVIVTISSLPYLWGMFCAPPGYHFVGLAHNIDDGAVYLSWMRQAAGGHFFIKNLFTNDPQAAKQFNVLFLAMGWFAAITRIPLIWVFHLFRIVSGFALILCIWQFSKLFLDDPGERRLLVPLVGLSSGVGWLIPNVIAMVGSVDMWQPEANTFLSIYLNPLFLAGLLLMIGVFYWLEITRREGRARYAVFAGIHLLLLGNVHTYDVATVGCVWVAYVIVLWIIERKFPARIVALSALAGAIAVPSVAYQFYLYRVDEVYRARANTPIPSPAIWSFFEGYGVVLLGAVVGAVLSRKAESGKWKARLLPVVWGVVGFAVPYIPIAQQRKLVMGLHIPLCILCAAGLVVLMRRLPGSLGRMILAAVLLFMVVSNVRFVSNDIRLMGEGRTVTHYVPYMSVYELSAMRYLRERTEAEDVVFAPPTFALFTPALVGRQVYYGHWSETPDYDDKYAQWRALADKSLTVGNWWYIVHDNAGSTYYVSEDPRMDPPAQLNGTYVKKCFEAGNVRIYRIIEPRAQGGENLLQ